MWIGFSVNNSDVIYVDSWEEYIRKEIKKCVGIKNLVTNIFRMRAFDSITCGYFCIAFIESRLKAKIFLEFINIFSSWDIIKNYDALYKYFDNKSRCYNI